MGSSRKGPRGQAGCKCNGLPGRTIVAIFRIRFSHASIAKLLSYAPFCKNRYGSIIHSYTYELYPVGRVLAGLNP